MVQRSANVTGAETHRGEEHGNVWWIKSTAYSSFGCESWSWSRQGWNKIKGCSWSVCIGPGVVTCGEVLWQVFCAGYLWEPEWWISPASVAVCVSPFSLFCSSSVCLLWLRAVHLQMLSNSFGVRVVSSCRMFCDVPSPSFSRKS